MSISTSISFPIEPELIKIVFFVSEQIEKRRNDLNKELVDLVDRFEIATESLHTDSAGDATLNTSRGVMDDKRHDSQSDDDEHKITMRSTVNNNVSINSSRHSDERSANGNASSNDDAGSDDESTTNKGKKTIFWDIFSDFIF